MNRLFSVLFILALAATLAGCVKYREFRVEFVNRNEHAIAARANGAEIGRVSPGGDLTFRFDARVLDYSGYNGHEADVNFTAYDLVTGRVTHAMQRVVQVDRIEVLEINTWDFN